MAAVLLFPTETEARPLRACRPDLDIRICGVGAAQTARFMQRMLAEERPEAVVLCGIAGAHLSTGYASEFTENITSGRGFTAFSAIVFGGRRARTAPLVYQSRDWDHGVFVGSIMASETVSYTHLRAHET